MSYWEIATRDKIQDLYGSSRDNIQESLLDFAVGGGGAEEGVLAEC